MLPADCAISLHRAGWQQVCSLPAWSLTTWWRWPCPCALMSSRSRRKARLRGGVRSQRGAAAWTTPKLSGEHDSSYPSDAPVMRSSLNRNYFSFLRFCFDPETLFKVQALTNRWSSWISSEGQNIVRIKDGIDILLRPECAHRFFIVYLLGSPPHCQCCLFNRVQGS